MQTHAPQGTARQFITITSPPQGAGGPTGTAVPPLALNSQTVTSVALSEDATEVAIRVLPGDTHRIVAAPGGTLESVMRSLVSALENPCPITLPPGAMLRGASRWG